jgi:hypothetical protein
VADVYLSLFGLVLFTSNIVALFDRLASCICVFVWWPLFV